MDQIRKDITEAAADRLKEMLKDVDDDGTTTEEALRMLDESIELGSKICEATTPTKLAEEKS